ncbi:hypothetical protein ABH932_000550 [Streptacidiphilus sp. MAP5-52]
MGVTDQDPDDQQPADDDQDADDVGPLTAERAAALIPKHIY